MEVLLGLITSLGMGGGSILILLLSIFTSSSQKAMQGINLIFFIPTALISIFINFKRKNINWKLSLFVTAFGIIGALVGSNIAMKLTDEILKKSFICFLILMTIYEIYGFIKKYILEANKE